MKTFVLLVIVAFGFFYVGTYFGSYKPNPDNFVAEREPVTGNDAPPGYLLINGERWGVSAFNFKAHNDSPEVGASNCGQRWIWYDAGPRLRPELREIMWHEVFHASYCYQGGRMKANWSQYVRDRGEHEIVYEAGMFLPGFVHDNPEFMKWAEEWK